MYSTMSWPSSTYEHQFSVNPPIWRDYCKNLYKSKKWDVSPFRNDINVQHIFQTISNTILDDKVWYASHIEQKNNRIEMYFLNNKIKLISTKTRHQINTMRKKQRPKNFVSLTSDRYFSMKTDANGNKIISSRKKSISIVLNRHLLILQQWVSE